MQVGGRVIFDPDRRLTADNGRTGAGSAQPVLSAARRGAAGQLGVMMISTRRFSARPAAVAFEAIGS